MMSGKFYLVYVKPINMTVEGKYVYELLFSIHPENVWGIYWDEENPSSCGDLTPEKSTYDIVKRIESNYKLTTIQEMGCLTMEHATMGVIALSWIDINVLEQYPSEGRMTLHFGDTIDVVNQILTPFEIIMEDINYGK
jgi:hypothetical protein